jgi:hypothetical protein
LRGEAAAAGLTGLRARGGGFIGRLRDPDVQARGPWYACPRQRVTPRSDSGSNPSLARGIR